MFIVAALNFKSRTVDYLCSVDTHAFSFGAVVPLFAFAFSCFYGDLNLMTPLSYNCTAGPATVLLSKTMKLRRLVWRSTWAFYRLLHLPCRNNFLLLVLLWIEFVKKTLQDKTSFRSHVSRAVWRQYCENKGTEDVPMSITLKKWTRLEKSENILWNM
jgi:hypothetical protein